MKRLNGLPTDYIHRQNASEYVTRRALCLDATLRSEIFNQYRRSAAASRRRLCDSYTACEHLHWMFWHPEVHISFCCYAAKGDTHTHTTKLTSMQHSQFRKEKLVCSRVITPIQEKS